LFIFVGEISVIVAFTIPAIFGAVQAVFVVLLCTRSVAAFAFTTIIGAAVTRFSCGFVALAISTTAIIAVAGTLLTGFACFAGAVSAASAVSIIVGAIFWAGKTIFVVPGFTFSVATHPITAMIRALVTADQYTIDFLPTYFVTAFEGIAWTTVAGAVVTVFTYALITKSIAAVIAAVDIAVVTVFPVFDIANPISAEARWLFAYAALSTSVSAAISGSNTSGIAKTARGR
jgi:hypothetical protein